MQAPSFPSLLDNVFKYMLHTLRCPVKQRFRKYQCEMASLTVTHGNCNTLRKLRCFSTIYCIYLFKKMTLNLKLSFVCMDM